jgi:hypothetical protein
MGIIRDKVNSIEARILLEITNHFPFSYQDVKTVYISVKSFDITITILDQSTRRGIAPGLIISAMKEELKGKISD